jgi:hypothetical protein
MAFAQRAFSGMASAVALAASSAFLGALGCNAILGIDEGHLVSADASAGGSSSGTGGSTTGSGGSGGNSGTGGSGTGGKGAGGTAGAGGSAGGGAGGLPGGVANEVRCGSASCKVSQGQVCCVATTSPFDAHCSTSCDPSLQAKFACDGAEDCTTAGDKCCYPTGQTTATCSPMCMGRVFCGADADCALGQYCAPSGGALASVSVCTNAPPKGSVWCGGAPCDAPKACCYNKTTKASQCSATCVANDVRFACDGADDCATGSVCCATLTGLRVFTGTSCIAGGCPTGALEAKCGGANGCTMGEACCVQSTGAACSANCAGGISCGTDADCAAAGMQCNVITSTAPGQPTGSTQCSSVPTP